jgi:hypothetical protein
MDNYTTIKVLSTIKFLGQNNSITKDNISKSKSSSIFFSLLFKPSWHILWFANFSTPAAIHKWKPYQNKYNLLSSNVACLSKASLLIINYSLIRDINSLLVPAPDKITSSTSECSELSVSLNIFNGKEDKEDISVGIILWMLLV